MSFPAILVASPTSVLAKVSPNPKTRLRLEKQISLYALPLAALVGPLAHQQDAALGQGFLQLLAPVGQIPQH